MLYVCGNHDDKYEQKPPEGCICIDDKIYVYKGFVSLGLEVPCAIKGMLSVYRRADGKESPKTLVSAFKKERI